MSQYAVTVMQEGQRGEVEALMAASFEKNLSSIFFLHTPTTLIVTCNDQVVAGLNLDVFVVNRRVKMGYLGWLYTHSEHRGRGLAGMLLEAAIPFLRDLGCTDIAGCVEGDNPASFKQLERALFSRMSLGEQIKRFTCGLPTVYRHASRFFDMGYFLWHRSLDGWKKKPQLEGIQALVATLAANLILSLPIILGWNVPALLGFTFVQDTRLLVAGIVLSLSVRTASQMVVAARAKAEVTYLGWDTAYLTALLAPLLLGLPFPVPGNVYIRGSHWSLKEHGGLLSQMALFSTCTLALLCVVIPNAYTLLLLLLDTLFSFYPFCGFNASRLKRAGRWTRLLSRVLLLACTIFLLLY
jgi:GNAT superfamily N-acetyltransferase